MQSYHKTHKTVPLPPLIDEDLAVRLPARLLISARTPEEAEARARRIHAASSRRDCPFVCASAGDLPDDERLLRVLYAELLEHAAGGTLFINAVDTMPTTVQRLVIALMDEVAPGSGSVPTVRLICGTSVPLLERVVDGRFADVLFYRLNIIHLMHPEPQA